VEIAHYQGECTVITKNGEPRAALVPYEWFREVESRRLAGLGSRTDQET
jgi:prevent-host-death family protein